MPQPNDDTVRSMADLLVEDGESPISTNISNANGTNGFPKPPRSNSKTSSNISADAPSENVDIEMNDSVFGDIALEEPPTVSFDKKTEVVEIPPKAPHHDHDLHHHSDFHDKKPDLQRHASLRSQLSTSSSHKETPKREIKLKLFVATLFIIIVTVVTVVHHFADLDLYRVELGKKIIVFEDTRWIHVKDINRDDALVGKFGLGIPENLLPHDCSENALRDTHLCLKWKDRAKVDIDYWEQNSSKCHNIAWQGLHRDTVLKDCYQLDNNKVHWFGGALKANQLWPLMNTSIPLMPYITGELNDDESFGPVIERYWLSSRGIAIFSPDLNIPLQISWNALNPADDNATTGDGLLCLVVGGKNSNFFRRGSIDQPLAYLNYTVCLSENILDVHQVALEKISDRRNISDVVHPELSHFKKPSLSVYRALGGDIDQSSLMQLGRALRNKSIDFGMMLIENGWQNYQGDLSFDSLKFPNSSGMIAELGDMNYEVILGVYPYISVHSRNFIPCVQEDMLVKDGGGNTPSVLKLKLNGMDNTNLTNLYTPLDISYQTAKDWIWKKLDRLRTPSKVEYFSFQGGMTTLLPYTFKLVDNSTDPNRYTHHYGQVSLADKSLALLGSATYLQGFPVVIRLPVTDLKFVLPIVLTLGMMGYPYVMVEMQLTPLGFLPSKDLYIRSVQLSAFLPIMHLSHPPDAFNDNTVVQIVQGLIKTHQDIVYERVLKHKFDSLLLDPIIKPLWWISPSDPEAMKRDTEFIVGDDLLIAPILKEFSVSRNIYLPKGNWSDRDGRVYEGPKLLENYPIKLHQVAYFTKV